MKITDVTLSILRTELGEGVIPTRGAVDKLPQLVLVSVATAEGIDGHYIRYLIPSKAVPHAAEVAKTILVGRDTYDVAALSHEMTTALPPYSNPPALAGADACLWDINAKAANLPLYKYLGAHRHEIRAYASTVAYPTIDGYVDRYELLWQRDSPRRKCTPSARPPETSSWQKRCEKNFRISIS